MTFTGFPPAAVEFYQQLELDNSKAWWSGHSRTYTEAVKTPMLALLAELEGEFGAAKVFRPHRDVRFSADKSPYKTHQGGYVSTGDGAGWYVQLGPQGLFVAGGIYQTATVQLARLRAAVADDTAGPALERVLTSLRRKGFEIGGEQLKTRPRGVPADHPRLDLLRRKAVTAGRDHGEPDWLATAEAAQRVRDDWRALQPLIEWIGAHVGSADGPGDRPGR